MQYQKTENKRYSNVKMAYNYNRYKDCVLSLPMSFLIVEGRASGSFEKGSKAFAE